MDSDQLTQLIKQGLSAMKSGSKTASQSASEVQSDASNDQLKKLLQKGTETSKQWQQRVDRALEQAGGSQQEQENEIMQAMDRVGKQIRQEAPNERVRDLGIIANGQLILHYWIGAFGTMEAYCKQAGMDQAAQEMKSCVSEAKQADEKYTDIAMQIMQQQQMASA